MSEPVTDSERQVARWMLQALADDGVIVVEGLAQVMADALAPQRERVRVLKEAARDYQDLVESDRFFAEAFHHATAAKQLRTALATFDNNG